MAAGDGPGSDDGGAVVTRAPHPTTVSRIVVGAGAALALAAVLVVVLSDDARWLRAGVLAALWAALVAVHALVRRSADPEAAELRRTYEQELAAEVAARREHELTFEQDLRAELESSRTGELDALRGEVERLRTALEQRSDGSGASARPARLHVVGGSGGPALDLASGVPSPPGAWTPPPPVARGPRPLPDMRVPDGRIADGRIADGRIADGRGPDGRGPDGRGPDGRGPDGRVPDGLGVGGRARDRRPVPDAWHGDVPPPDLRHPEPRSPDPRAPDSRPTEARPPESRPIDARPTDARPTDARPTDARPTDGAIAEAAARRGDSRTVAELLAAHGGSGPLSTSRRRRRDDVGR